MKGEASREDSKSVEDTETIGDVDIANMTKVKANQSKTKRSNAKKMGMQVPANNTRIERNEEKERGSSTWKSEDKSDEKTGVERTTEMGR